MQRVSKGRLAGKTVDDPTELGFASMAPGDALAVALATMGQLFDASAYIGEDGVVMACSASLLAKTGLKASSVVGAAFKNLVYGEDDKSRLDLAMREALEAGDGVVALKLKSTRARALPANVRLTVLDCAGFKRVLATMSVWVDGENGSMARLGEGLFEHIKGVLSRQDFLRAASVALDNDGFKDRPAVISLDVDNLGEINARLGQACGDAVIEQVEERVRLLLRRGDWAGRMGSDEFCVYASLAGNPTDAQAVATRLLASMEQPIDVGGGVLEQIKVTLGVALGPKDGATISALLSSAEKALKEAREKEEPWLFAA